MLLQLISVEIDDRFLFLTDVGEGHQLKLMVKFAPLDQEVIDSHFFSYISVEFP